MSCLKLKNLFVLCALIVISAEAKSQGLREPVYIVIGGFNSCGGKQPIATNFARGKYLQDLFLQVETSSPYSYYFKRTKNTRYVFACFENAQAGYPYGLLQYGYSFAESAAEPMAVEGIDDMVKALRDLIIDHFSQRDVHIISHSWGATVAMKVAALLPQRLQLSSLVTQDAIDHSCHRNGKVIPTQALNGFCRGTPLVALEYGRLIARHVRPGAWFNYYQNRALVLHGGPIREAVNLDQHTFPLGWVGLQAHVNISNMRKVWLGVAPFLLGLR